MPKHVLSSGNRFIFHLPWLIWIIVISLLSFIPGDQLPEIKWELISVSTVAHFGMYFMLSVLLIFGFFYRKMNLINIKMYMILVLVGLAFGIFVEVIQGSFIYRRYFDVMDIVANFIGTLFGMFIGVQINRKLV